MPVYFLLFKASYWFQPIFAPAAPSTRILSLALSTNLRSYWEEERSGFESQLSTLNSVDLGKLFNLFEPQFPLGFYHRFLWGIRDHVHTVLIQEVYLYWFPSSDPLSKAQFSSSLSLQHFYWLRPYTYFSCVIRFVIIICVRELMTSFKYFLF